MSKTSAHNIDINDLLSSAARLKIKDLESFARELNAIITRKKAKNKDYQEAALLSKHNQTILPKGQRDRFLELLQKMEAEEMDERERLEFLELTKEEERLRNERVKILIELSQLKRISFSELMKELGLTPPQGNA